jgi:LacI family transcriptional regulator
MTGNQTFAMVTAKAPFRRTVGLRRIADEVGVSVSLVSKVLNGRMGKTGAQASKIAAIREKAIELGYRKNLLAQALRTGRQNVLAVCVHRLGEPGSGIVEEMVAGIAAEAVSHRQRLMLHYYESAEEFRAFAPELQRNAADGVIMGGLGHPELIKDLKSMHARGLPVVTIHDEQLDPSFANIQLNQDDLGCEATRHLISRGCRAIAHFSVPQTSRCDGYRRAMAEAGLGQYEDLVVDAGKYSYQAGVLAVRELLRRGVHFDGIVGSSDQHAAAALNELLARGYDVPGRVKLIGMDDAPFCPFAAVPLSSVSQEYALRGRHAVRLLLSALDGKLVRSVHVAPVVCARTSSSVSTEVVPCQSH